MECKACGKWFVSGDKSGVCHTCKRTLKNIGLDLPYDRLRELVEADRDGRCVVFPCKVGDIVYTNIAFEMYGYTTSKRTYSAKVVYVGMTDRGIRLVIEFDNGRTMQVTNMDIGYFVFFTKEAAEAVMKGEQDG